MSKSSTRLGPNSNDFHQSPEQPLSQVGAVPAGRTPFLVTQQQASSQLIQYPAPYIVLLPAWLLHMLLSENMKKISKLKKKKEKLFGMDKKTESV